MIKVGVIGYGYWGPNVARNFNLPGVAQVIAIADKSEKSQKRAAEAFPHVKVVSDTQEILNNTEIDVVAVVTPVWTHFELAKAALNHGKHVFVEKPFTASEYVLAMIERGKHVFVEKPFTASVAQAEELIELAARKH